MNQYSDVAFWVQEQFLLNGEYVWKWLMPLSSKDSWKKIIDHRNRFEDFMDESKWEPLPDDWEPPTEEEMRIANNKPTGNSVLDRISARVKRQQFECN